MKVGYFDCFAGIAGDMALGAILDAGCSLAAIKEGLSSMSSISGEWDIEASNCKKSDGCIHATAVKVVDAHRNHHHRNFADVKRIISAGTLLPEAVRENSIAVFQCLAEAEATVHGCTVEEVHFHEVGAIDSIVDTVGTVFGLHLLGIQELYCSPVPFTTGSIRTAHGRLPVPAPATMHLLKNHIPLKPPACDEMSGELVTPTGASILRTLVKRENAGIAPPHQWIVERVGVGAGSRNPAGYPNICRLIIGNVQVSSGLATSRLVILEANIDDMSGEVAGYVFELLMDRKEVLDVWYTGIHMKKNRPGVKLSVLTQPENAENIRQIIFAETTTLGIRLTTVERTALHRRFEVVQTSFGPVRMKLAFLNKVLINASPEHENLKNLAQHANVPLKIVAEEAKSKFNEVISKYQTSD